MNARVADAAQIIEQNAELLKKLHTEVSRVIVGNETVIESILIALLANGHVLLEGAPGIAKTTLLKAFSQALQVDFKRIQFTPDLLPSDLIGAQIYNPKNNEFETRKGPIFANFVLADEINRAPAKVQAALLEAMQEHQVTIGGHTFTIDEPFFVFATQNPIEQQGTYELPEAQVDRFLLKVLMTYPRQDEELEILTRSTHKAAINSVLTKEDLLKAQDLVKTIYVNDRVLEYMVRLIHATRTPADFGLKKIAEFITYGSSPRGTLALLIASQARALLKNRSFVTPDDVKAVAPAVLRHRLMLSFRADAQNITADIIIREILATVPTP